MTDFRSPADDARRSFLARLAAGIAVAGGGLLAGARPAEARAGASFQPARHAQDDWLDQVTGQHRFVFDTTNPEGFGTALLYANNFFNASQSGYGLKDADTAVVVVARHNSTACAFGDAIWVKYGALLGSRIGLTDPRTKQPPTVNLFNARVTELPSRGTTIDSLVKRGAHLAVCQMATRFLAGLIAEATAGNAEAVYQEIAANLVGNAHLMAAGIVAVNRAQERGYTLATA